MTPKIARAGSGKLDKSRKLSFVDFTFGDYVAAEEATFRRVDPNFELDPQGWESAYAVLCQPVNTLFKPLECRTLCYWVKCFNAWQGLKGSGKKAPGRVNGKQLPEMLKISQQDANKILRLFDRKNGQKLVSEGANNRVLEMLEVSPKTIMLAGVLISTLIDESSKFTFMLGLFDEDDRGGLDEDDYFEWIQAFAEASSAVFGAPSASPRREAASQVFHMTSKLAAKKLQEKATLDPVAREAILEALKSRLSAPAPTRKRSLSYSALQEATSGKDGGNLLWRLIMKRFCGPRQEKDSSQFKLSRKAPVPIPESSAIVHDADLPRRLEVVVVRDAVAIYKDTPTYKLSDLTGIVQASSPYKLLCASGVSNILDNLIESFKDITLDFQNETAAFVHLLRRMYPKAQSKHLRMFKLWCEQYDELAEKEKDLESKLQALDTVKTHDLKPLIPEQLLQDLTHEFEGFADPDSGTASNEAIANYFELDPDIVTYTLDANEDGSVSLREFLCVACPPQYALPAVHTKATRMFRALLEYACNEAQADVQASINEFTSSKHAGDVITLADLKAIVKAEEVPEHVWCDWQNLFQELDRNGDGAIDLKELLKAGAFDTDVSSVLISFMDPKRKLSFTKERFLTMMLKAHGFWKRDML